jgi:hypothetical protein
LDKCGISSVSHLKVKTHRLAVGAFSGVIKNMNTGRVIPNSATNALKAASAKGAATGTMNAFNKARVKCTDVTEYEVNITLIAGGDASCDYATFEFEWENDKGISKTIDQLEMGYDLGGGGELIYVQSGTGLAEVVANTLTIKYTWTVQFNYSSGCMTELYRKSVAQMIATGAFQIMNKCDFRTTLSASNCETISLLDGGDGVEIYHKWGGTHVAGGEETIDVLYWGYGTACPPTTIYGEDNIANKVMSESEELEADITITHN